MPLDDQMSPTAGRDYPRAYSQMRGWFDEDWKCRDYLNWLRWPDGFVCPRCGISPTRELHQGRTVRRRQSRPQRRSAGVKRKRPLVGGQQSVEQSAVIEINDHCGVDVGRVHLADELTTASTGRQHVEAVSYTH